MFKLLDSFWHENRAPDAAAPDWRDWLLVSAAATLTVIEGALSDEIVAKPVAIGLTIAMLIPLAWRRTHPLLMVLLAFGLNTLVQNSARLLQLEWTSFVTTVFLMIFPYSLFRWASGKEAFAGLGFLYLTYALTIGLNDTPPGELLAGALFFVLGATLGASARSREAADRKTKQQVRLREREQLARELHDTVAHHVSAIAIQAQAGRAAAVTQPEAPLEALGVIEDAASKTLNEMRRIVRAMRAEGTPDFAPAASIRDIEHLALDNSYPLEIDVTLSGDLHDLDSSLAATLFRLTQESITNAIRHADGAERVCVRIQGHEKQIQLIVEDDGKPVGKQSPSGLGLQGMIERVTLLGGSITAGPGHRQGWIVNATLPRTDTSR